MKKKIYNPFILFLFIPVVIVQISLLIVIYYGKVNGYVTYLMIKKYVEWNKKYSYPYLKKDMEKEFYEKLKDKIKKETKENDKKKYYKKDQNKNNNKKNERKVNNKKNIKFKTNDFELFIRCFNYNKKNKKSYINKKWVNYSDAGKYIKGAIIFLEDQKFFSHNGFDYESIKEALETNKRAKIKRGASTISQQVAKNLFLYPDRNYVRKILEAYFTVLIEIYWTKERILEYYINIAETGVGIYGVEKASYIYYKTNSKNLTIYQASSIAGSLTNPVWFNPNSIYRIFIEEKINNVSNNLNNFFAKNPQIYYRL